MANTSIKPWHILLLTCRDPETDFRLPLAEELQLLGHDVYYIYLKRRPVIISMGGKDPRIELSILGFLFYALRKFRPLSPLLVFNSTNLVFPGLSRILRLICGGFWILDMHDELTYGKTGPAKDKALKALQTLLSGSDMIVHAAPTLKELFPTSQHLGNASTVTAIARPQPDFSKVLILASIDERLDFDFLLAAARSAPELTFEIYGQIAGNNPEIRKRVEDAVKMQANVRHCGAYVNSDLPRILGDYTVTLAPYMLSSPLTYYIDPLRYYHCLNSGMEVISTAIPKAEDFGKQIHIARDPAEIGPLVKGLADSTIAKRNAGSTAAIYNWKNRAIRVIELADAAGA
jgi:glycosyltransferase involved in cell wall biosynthesis